MMRVCRPETMAGMADGCVLVFSQVAAHPGNAFAAHDVVGVDHRFQAGNGSHMSAHHDHRTPEIVPAPSGTSLGPCKTLTMIEEMTNDVVVVRG